MQLPYNIVKVSKRKQCSQVYLVLRIRKQVNQVRESKRLHNLIVVLFVVIFLLSGLLIHFVFKCQDLYSSKESNSYIVDTSNFKMVDSLTVRNAQIVSSVQYRLDSTEMLVSVQLEDKEEIYELLPQIKAYFVKFMNDHKVIGREGEPTSYGVLTVTDSRNNKVAQYTLPNVNSTKLTQIYKGSSVMYYTPKLIER